MRPEILFRLFSDVTNLNGVGPGVRKALARLWNKGANDRVVIRDVVFYLPIDVIDRRASPPLAHAKTGEIVTMEMTIESHHPPERKGGKSPYKIICHTQEGYVTLVFFHARADYLKTLLPVGTTKAISGKVERYAGGVNIPHPDIIAPAAELPKLKTLEPVYGLTYGLSNRQLGKIMRAALQSMPDLPEWIDPTLLSRKKWQGWKTSLTALHHPDSPEKLLPVSSERERMAYDELLANQIALGIVRGRMRQKNAPAITPRGTLRSRLLDALPYPLTQGQKTVLSEIDEDLASGLRMLRLLQGDVGSGKTVVALLACLSVIEEGGQAALMVPTELLGKQHFSFIERYVSPLGISAVLLTGGMKYKEYNETLERIAQGDASIVIGTHALFQEKVAFKNLALAVIDEQHRFGVGQRLGLASKAPNTHLLVMTATPIPRTLAMTAFGDMDCSLLKEKPAGRQEIKTLAVPFSRSEEVLEAVGRALGKKEKVYWICPLVEESEDENTASDLAAVAARHTEFLHRFSPSVGMAHGKMAAQERDAIMRGFAGEHFHMLVATTVVEVGVDVPNATVIVIEHAERFGLAQLHQLRGRVGRSDKPSVCILLYKDNCGDTAKARLRIIRETGDGFRIAEEDARLRGGGDILGLRQSGFPDFTFADLNTHSELLSIARQDAKFILHQDEKLVSPRGKALRTLLYLFGYDDNIKFLGAG